MSIFSNKFFVFNSNSPSHLLLIEYLKFVALDAFKEMAFPPIDDLILKLSSKFSFSNKYLNIISVLLLEPPF